MDKKVFSETIKKIQSAYKKEFTTDELKLWYEEFKTTDEEEFKKAITKTIQEVKYIPKIAEVRARVEVNPNDYYTKDQYRYLYKNNEWGEFID